jgi:phosphoenolpyruvate synthase/pyruvate phosphate dikinase
MQVIDRSTARLGFGGKGNSLEWLREHGYASPSFDLLDANCWRGLLDSEPIRSVLRTVSYGVDDFSFRLACLQVREAIESAPTPAVVDEWLSTEPLRRLGRNVAVRSSALTEDGSSFSSAGQYESILGVSDERGLDLALRRVLASYYGDRAVLYRRARGIAGGTELEMGLIVQELVEAEVCGIAFSINPVTRKGGVVIEASWGLGPPLVSGETEPDRFEFARGADEPVVRVGRKHRRLSFDRVSMDLRYESSDGAGDLCMPVATAMEIAARVTEMEGHYGSPVDVEWAIPSGRPEEVLYLQIRPVTAADLPVPNDLMTTY